MVKFFSEKNFLSYYEYCDIVIFVCTLLHVTQILRNILCHSTISIFNEDFAILENNRNAAPRLSQSLTFVLLSNKKKMKDDLRKYNKIWTQLLLTFESNKYFQWRLVRKQSLLLLTQSTLSSSDSRV